MRVRWNSRCGSESMWEHEHKHLIKLWYPQLFRRLNQLSLSLVNFGTFKLGMMWHLGKIHSHPDLTLCCLGLLIKFQDEISFNLGMMRQPGISRPFTVYHFLSHSVLHCNHE
ncbi:hypothetical protein HanPI659440_Chr17g0700751 [Helianthus annuus]|nr:hypothetical protein HanPI659440_Chr17g0700751 [Helianthus annuus]